jgi:hypothetical protein
LAVQRRKARGSVAFGLAIALGVAATVAACGGSSSPANPSGQASGAGPSGSGGGSLTVGLSANLDKLTSYRFTESNAGMAGGAGATPVGSGSYEIAGTVVNRPLKSIWIGEAQGQFILIGSQAWASADGITWVASDPGDTILTDLLPGHDYALWFDAKASYFRAVGEESKNDIPCVHYKADQSLGSIYADATGAPAAFKAELWVARSGDFPVSGVYSFAAAAGASGGSWGFSFDITHPGDSTNVVAAPTNVVALPSTG